ncbi:creatininase family protein [Clostridiaceae bacterium M8S5]|nr:creatininase family protein [Clostridiaceae bacterium M8S5]
MSKNSIKKYKDYTVLELSKILPNNSLMLPIGSIEQHGPHLPLSVDTDIAVAICNELCLKNQWIQAPQISYMSRSLPQSGGKNPCKGTIWVNASTVINYLVDIIHQYSNTGLKNIFIINGHYENEAFIFEAIEICKERGFLINTNIIALSWWSVVKDEFIKSITNDKFVGWHAEHAGLTETALMLYIKPNSVRYINKDFSKLPACGIYYHNSIDDLSQQENGVLSSSEGASLNLGKKLFDHICDELSKILTQGKGGCA